VSLWLTLIKKLRRVYFCFRNRWHVVNNYLFYFVQLGYRSPAIKGDLSFTEFLSLIYGIIFSYAVIIILMTQNRLIEHEASKQVNLPPENEFDQVQTFHISIVAVTWKFPAENWKKKGWESMSPHHRSAPIIFPKILCFKY